jgi:hypothetical protein
MCIGRYGTGTSGLGTPERPISCLEPTERSRDRKQEGKQIVGVRELIAHLFLEVSAFYQLSENCGVD